ncbi:MAG TPA: isoprenylcysteine carboxylmethyltransferase family protein [Capillimicrobium sp.]|nr:isoprenylcysteine carboxylmethyltransferase family protein [Capillimicrobium sp.]
MDGRAKAAIASAAFLVLASGIEAVLAPWLLTGWERGDGILDGPVGVVAGALLVAAGAAALLWTYARFVAEGAGTPSPLLPPRELVVGGPYRFVRNPMYVATAAVIAGEGVLLARPVLLVAAGAYLAAFAVFVRRVEEPLLARRFGASWERYRAAVPGWRPRLTPWRG